MGMWNQFRRRRRLLVAVCTTAALLFIRHSVNSTHSNNSDNSLDSRLSDSQQSLHSSHSQDTYRTERPGSPRDLHDQHPIDLPTTKPPYEWKCHQIGDEPVICLLSAVYDDRQEQAPSLEDHVPPPQRKSPPTTENAPPTKHHVTGALVRILGAARRDFDDYAIYCVFPDMTSSYNLSLAERHEVGRQTWLFGDTRWRSVEYSCPVTGGSRPATVGLTESSYSPAVTLPVRYPPGGPRVPGLAVCVPPAYGDLCPAQLVEWMELQLMLGATHITLYAVNITNDVTSILKYYIRQGALTVHLVPPLHGVSHESVKLTMGAVLNDCLLRHAHDVTHVLIVDLDEMVVPREDLTLTQLMESYDGDEDTSGRDLQFNSRFFDPVAVVPGVSGLEKYGDGSLGGAGAGGCGDCCGWLPRSQTRLTVRHNSLTWPKSVVRPATCLLVYTHFCELRVTSQHSAVQVPPEIAIVGHYRNKLVGSMASGRAERDDVMLRYGAELGARVWQVKEEIEATAVGGV